MSFTFHFSPFGLDDDDNNIDNNDDGGNDARCLPVCVFFHFGVVHV